MITVAGYIAKFLKGHKINHIFGFQGSAMLKMLDEIVDEGIEYVQNFNEQASGFGADAYARINGIGAAIATSGPGAVNLIGGIANAYFDSVPLIFITGQDYSTGILANNGARQNGFQDMDIVSMVRPITKYAVLLDKPENVRYELEKAYYFATTGRKGSVLIDVPIDVQFKEIDETLLKGFEKPLQDGNDYRISEIIKLLKASSRPVVLAGGGIRGADAVAEFREFANKTHIPVIATLNGIDTIENLVGFSGLYGNSEANLAIKNADLIIALGARFSLKQIGKKKEQYNLSAKIIHVDIDEAEINRTFMKEDVSVIADLKGFLKAINQQKIKLEIKNWLAQVQTWQNLYKDMVVCSLKGVDPVKLVREIAEYADNNAVFTADVGANQMWVAQGLRLKAEQRLLNSAGFGAMGYSLPAGIGASYRAPEVISFTGDGGLQMNLQELNTLALRRNNVKCVVFNNNNLGLMRDVQLRYYNNHFYGNNDKEFSCPDLEKLAEAFNLGYISIATENDFVNLKEVFECNEPYIIDVRIDKDTIPLNRYDDKALRKRIYLDFDGTLINSQGRLYRLFKELCPECDLSEEEYNNLKRTRISQKKLLQDRYGYSDEQAEAFHQVWMEKIEEKDRIETDFPYDGMTSVLEKLSKTNDLYLVTHRQRKDLAYSQIEKFGWSKFFKELLITEGKMSKVDIIRSITEPLPCDVLIGDTGEDIKCAHELGIHSIAVCWGILNKEILSEYQPDFIAERIEDLDYCSFL
ncbi:MAG: HAD hydrolase-like protein [Alphaproteobacteria bacterium]|nr:HAD hydrolase-like protein [Alphaproteobacteria bacterium]